MDEIKVKRILIEWKKHCNYTRIIQFKYSKENQTLIIYTSLPKMLIGENQKYAKKFENKIKKQNPMIKNIKYVKVCWRTA